MVPLRLVTIRLPVCGTVTVSGSGFVKGCDSTGNPIATLRSRKTSSNTIYDDTVSSKSYTTLLNTESEKQSPTDNISPRTKGEFAAYKELGFRYPDESLRN